MTPTDQEVEAVARTIHSRHRDWLRKNGSNTPSYDSADMDFQYKQSLRDHARAAIAALDQARSNA